MYEKFYDFTAMPFQLTPDSRFFYGFRLHTLFAMDGTPRAMALTSPKIRAWWGRQPIQLSDA